MSLSLHKDSPLRPVDWRWQRALLLLDDDLEPSRVRDDQHIHTALAYHRYVRTLAERERERVLDRFPAIANAHQCHDRESSKAEIEARLLAEEPFESIAFKMAMTTDIVVWYERLFFNVLDRIKQLSYIIDMAIGPEVHHGINEQDYPLLWKLFAFAGGVNVLDAAVHIFTLYGKFGVDQVETFYSDQAWSLMKRRMLTSALTLRARDSFSKMQFMEVFARYQEMERQANAGVDKDILFDHIRAMLTGVRWLPVAQKPEEAPTYEIVDGWAVEPRARDISRLPALVEAHS